MTHQIVVPTAESSGATDGTGKIKVTFNWMMHVIFGFGLMANLFTLLAYYDPEEIWNRRPPPRPSEMVRLHCNTLHCTLQHTTLQHTTRYCNTLKLEQPAGYVLWRWCVCNTLQRTLQDTATHATHHDILQHTQTNIQITTIHAARYRLSLEICNTPQYMQHTTT
mmetsp:Transcript_97042/g.141986  ORF Transcript_97042/g.141986 Transcript_97042/m.141986 type:complete len:165 (+) Transcript_97042:574-1068(+)